MHKSHITIATRKSPLALWQAESIKQALLKHHPHLTITLMGMRTQADKFLHMPLQNIGGKGLFVKELETALIEEQADIAVHSIKDLPAVLPEELLLAVICKREDPRDVLVAYHSATLADLPNDAKIGTSSLRRQCQLRALRPDLRFFNLRGNVDSRLQKLAAGEFDAIVLAAAGLKRLKHTAHIREYFAVHKLIPAIGQGAIGIECRKKDQETQNLISCLDDEITRQCILAERAMNAEFGGNCQIPIAAHAWIDQEKLQLIGMIGQINGEIILRSQQKGNVAHSEQLGKTLAADLIRQGALELLKN